MVKKLIAMAVLLAACSGAGSVETTGIADLPAMTVEEFEARLAESDKPTVANVWASWCGPCRSEAPVLNEAHAIHGEKIDFIGVNVQDSQAGANGFLAEFGLDFEHVFDRERAIPNFYGGLGVPITMFFTAQGEQLTIHNGVIDERTLALNIDELLQTASR